MGSSLVPVIIALILLEIHKNSECHKIEVTPDPGTIVIFSKKAAQAVNCSVCTGEGPSQTCNSFLRLKEPQTTTVNFNCSQPGDVFTVEINQEIDCTDSSCNNIDAVHPDSTRFLEFTRTFTWDLKVPESKTFQLDFPAPGLRQIKPSEPCPNKHTYTLIAYQRTGPTSIGTFCQNGTISRIQVLHKGRVSLEVPKGTDLNPSDFKVSMGAETKVLVEVDSKLPRGQSSTDYFTPNYALGLFSDEKMKWNFAVEPMHNFSVLFQDYTAPECQKRALSLEYTLGDKTVLTKTLKDDQPANKQGDFSLALANCEQKRGTKGLSLNFKVSVFRSGSPYLCTVDLQNEEGLSLQIENKNPKSYCEMKMNSVVQEKIVVPVGTKADLSFLDCPVEELQLTGTKNIDCLTGSTCAVSGTTLTIPMLGSTLPAPLQQFTWLLRVPDQNTVDLTYPQGNLHQSVPEKECNERVSLLVSESDGSNIGQFCSFGKGAIQKIQIKANVSITAMPKSIKDLSQDKGPFLNITLSPEISENVVYSVSPLVLGTTYLATPNWPNGMNPSSSVTWIVNVPQEHRAELQFTNVSKPKCDTGHTTVEIQQLGSNGHSQSWREDQSVPNIVNQLESFYLNMSNCEPKSGSFAVLSKVTLLKETKNVLGIIFAVVGVLLILLIIALIVVCVICKKKKPKANRSSIVMPRGNALLPGNATFPKTRADNESHVYASIEDSKVYGHLLDKDQPAVESDNGAWSNGHQVDMYRPFTGPTDPTPVITESPVDYSLDRGEERGGDRSFLDPSSTFMPGRPRTPLISQSSLGFEDRRMVANELNTFKSFGDINAIRLSADESRLQPQSDSDSDLYTEPEYEETV
ncbi:CUB domain-containing protein 1-like [Xyrauchen texanus]|uniref:CUB domain-containing protein 1-like n=1 Tax=Xyrauchen texanus TaxID=154827 RepID=UPI002241C2F3|nr:CUB domain-containing protein 1-like [Xyrauchen texanus]XP_051991081.1 CUB domain-containing protein 1-like [Xyrauchen texanus]